MSKVNGRKEAVKKKEGQSKRGTAVLVCAGAK